MLLRRIFARSTSRLALAVLCALAIGAGWASGASATPQYRGASAHSTWSSVSSGEMTRELAALQSAGANVVRVDFDWRTLEWAGKGQYDPTYLAKLDALMSEASARGLKVIAILACTPPWASAGKEWNDAPSEPADYGDVARFLAARYGGKLAAIEAWNEPEIHKNLIASNLAQTYTEMVKQLYRGAREGDPNVAVLAGSLSYADTTFMNELYADGIAGHYDGVSLHPYADQADPTNTSVTHSFKRGIEEMHADQLAHGDDTPEWITEFGWYVGGASGAVSEQQQGEYVEKAFAVLNGISYVEGATVYELRDMAVNASDPEDNFGLLRNDFTQRPVYASFRAAMGAPSATVPSEPSPSSASTPPATTAQPPPSQPAATQTQPPAAGTLLTASKTTTVERPARKSRHARGANRTVAGIASVRTHARSARHPHHKHHRKHRKHSRHRHHRPRRHHR